MVSVLILTLNEEDNLPSCLDSVAWSNDVVVLDSGSQDDTVRLAKKRGARVVKRPFDNFAAHQNWALKNIKFKNKWVFYLDADERMTSDLKQELIAVSEKRDTKEVGFFVGRKNYFWGKWLKRSFPPVPIYRFFIPGKVEFVEAGHGPAPIIRGPYGRLYPLFEHYNFSKGFDEWFERHNRYTSQEAREGLKKKQELNLSGLFSENAYLRRKNLKALRFHLPFKPFLKFIYMYFLKLGFLDGRPGFEYCVMQFCVECMIGLKMKELEMERQGRKP
jgi:glycosyltransferase involved in cell wall biosynthesis